MHLAVRRKCAEDAKSSRRKARQAEEREARRQLRKRGLLAKAGTSLLEPFRGTRLGKPITQASPELGLPDRVLGKIPPRSVGVLPVRPRAKHLGSIEPVAVEQTGEVAYAAESARVFALV